MRKSTKIISLMLALLILLCFTITSCKKDEPSDTDSDTSVPQTDAPPVDVPPQPIVLADKGEVVFEMVMPEDLDELRRDMVRDLVTDLTRYTGDSSIDVTLSDTNSYDASAKQILIDDTGYTESDEVLNSLGYGEWTVRFVNNKLVIAAYSNQGYYMAIKSFLKDIKSTVTEDKSVTLLSDYNTLTVEIEQANMLPRFDGKKPWVVDEGENTALALFTNTNVEDYNAYLEKITAAGYTLYTTNTMAGNLFNTYDNGEYVIHAAYYKADKSMRITAEKKTALVPREGEDKWTANASVVSSLALVGASEKASQTLGCVYQLADGSFIIIDGGMEYCANDIYRYVKAKAPDPNNIVIAAWIITHLDADHHRAFTSFFAIDEDNTSVEKVILSSAGAYSYLEGNAGDESGVVYLAERLPGCQVIKAHTGQKYYIRNAVVEILYSLDNHFPEIVNNFNAISLVFTVEISGDKALFMGDATESVATKMLDMYGDYVKSDMLQLSHHGQRNGTGLSMAGTERLYTVIRPEVVLWPASEEGYFDESLGEGKIMYKYSWNIVAMSGARETYLAGHDITVFELPYSFFSAYKFDPSVSREPVRSDNASSSSNLNYNNTMSDASINKVSWNDK